jgi:hypothetical protein
VRRPGGPRSNPETPVAAKLLSAVTVPEQIVTSVHKYRASPLNPWSSAKRSRSNSESRPCNKPTNTTSILHRQNTSVVRRYRNAAIVGMASPIAEYGGVIDSHIMVAYSKEYSMSALVSWKRRPSGGETPEQESVLRSSLYVALDK